MTPEKIDKALKSRFQTKFTKFRNLKIKSEMKWIKASERLPELDNFEDYPKEYIVRTYDEDDLRGGYFVNYFYSRQHDKRRFKRFRF